MVGEAAGEGRGRRHEERGGGRDGREEEGGAGARERGGVEGRVEAPAGVGEVVVEAGGLVGDLWEIGGDLQVEEGVGFFERDEAEVDGVEVWADVETELAELEELFYFGDFVVLLALAGALMGQGFGSRRVCS